MGFIIVFIFALPIIALFIGLLRRNIKAPDKQKFKISLINFAIWLVSEFAFEYCLDQAKGWDGLMYAGWGWTNQAFLIIFGVAMIGSLVSTVVCIVDERKKQNDNVEKEEH